MGKPKHPVSLEVARLAKDLRDQEPRNTRVGPHGYGLKYVRESLRRGGLGDHSLDQIDAAVRTFDEQAPDFDKLDREFRAAYLADNPGAERVPTRAEWHRERRALAIPRKQSSGSGSR